MESLRPLLTSYAYNILGSTDDAKDIVQDAFLKFISVDQSKIDNKKAYLTRMVINLSINQKKRQQKLLSFYPGEWLPEPVSSEGADSSLLKKDILSYSLMVLLEKVSPRQRAVFILKEAFDYDHSEISDIIGTSEENSRKLLSRAKKQLQGQALLSSKSYSSEHFKRYLETIQSGDTGKLEQLLNDDIAVISDGGGKVSAGIHPVKGKKAALAMLNGIYRKFYRNRECKFGEVNHLPALFYYENDVLTTCQIYWFENDLLRGVFIVRNPDKLKMLK